MGAGIIIVKYVDKNPKYLGLLAKHNQIKKYEGIYDLPKGTPEAGESIWQTAFRECYEEIGYKAKQDNIIAGPYYHDGLTMWIAVVPESMEPKLEMNPESGIYEHNGYEWLSFDQIYENCFRYLKPFILWAHKNL